MGLGIGSWLRRRRESVRAREVEDALADERRNALRESAYETVDEVNVASAGGLLGGTGFGRGWRQGTRQQLREEGYEGD